MITIPGSFSRFCDNISRREFLQIGGLGAAGLTLPDLFGARAKAAERGMTRSAGRAKSCILLFMGGGLAVLLGIAALGAVTFPLAFVFFIFEVGLVATLQAFIFSTLSAIYIGGATSASH